MVTYRSEQVTLAIVVFVCVLTVLPLRVSGQTLTIDNDVSQGTLGHFSVVVEDGGESSQAFVTAERFTSGDLITGDVLFNYFSYVDVGDEGGAFRLSGSPPIVSVSDPDTVVSVGSFAGENGNTINWMVTSFIPDSGRAMTNLIVFESADGGPLGRLRFLQYLDEDVEEIGDDVFFTRGSVAGRNLELFTVDGLEIYGISQSGAFDDSGGLDNAAFSGWAADVFDNMRPRITGTGQPVSPTGIINNLATFEHPELGTVRGPADVVSMIAWDVVDPTASAATVVTALGGVPSIRATRPELSIVITQPVDGATFNVGDPITVEGQVTVGTLAGAASNVLYTIDISGSTANTAGDCNGDGVVNVGDDFNNDELQGEIIDCEIAGVIALNESLIGMADIEGGLVAFASDAVVADVGPAAGQQDFTSPLDADNNGNLVPDLDEVARSLNTDGLFTSFVGEFTAFSFASGTNFNNAISSINSAFSSQLGETNIAFFLSDGMPEPSTSFTTGPGSPLQNAASAGTVINTFSIGPSAAGCGAGSPLRTIADVTGGTCTPVDDPSDLSTVLPGTTPAMVDRVEVEGTEVDVDALGNFTATVSCPGPTDNFVVTATAFAIDPNDPSDPDDDIEFSASDSVQLICQEGGPIVDAGPDQTVACTSPVGAEVTLDGTATPVDPEGEPLFTWTNSFGTVTGPTPRVTIPLGTETITLTVTDGATTAADTVQVTVVDTTRPRIAATVVAVDDGGGRGLRFQCTDRCDPNPTVVAATIDGQPVSNGEVIALPGGDGGPILRRVTLEASCQDASGNLTTTTKVLRVRLGG